MLKITQTAHSSGANAKLFPTPATAATSATAAPAARATTACPAATLTVEGRLVGPWVEELRRTAGELALARSVIIDLEGLQFADPDGVALLRDLRDAGMKLVGSSTFVATLIGAS